MALSQPLIYNIGYANSEFLTDLQSKFPQFSDLMDFWANVYPEDPDFRYDFMKSDIIFARWKERHFVPDHKQDIRGACFAGFYCTSFLGLRINFRCIVSEEYWEYHWVVLPQELGDVCPTRVVTC